MLVIETSTDTASVVAVVGGRVVFSRGFVGDRRHNAVLFGPLREAVDALAGRRAEVVLVGSGPGSYSGTRVGIAAAQGAAMVLGCKAVAVPSVLGVAEVGTGNGCLAVGDARRGVWWFAAMAGGVLRHDPELTDEDGFEKRLELAEREGDFIFSFEPVLGREIVMGRPDAEGLWRAWMRAPEEMRRQWAAVTAQPIYLKPPHITESKRTVYVGS